MQLDFNLSVPLTVTELTRRIKDSLETEFPDVWVQGEVTGLRIPSSGHIYFALKDKEAQIRAVFFRSGSRYLKFRPEDGLEVIARGRLSVYEARGEYQLIVEYMEPKGLGALQLAFLQLKEKLGKEGLFDESRKRPLPAYPKSVGVVTSPTGAAIKDILKVLGRRAPGVRVLLAPATVQGESAPSEIASAIEDLNACGGLDVIIAGRGGGSVEDLAAFNTEVVARAIAASKVPVISAVGHEVDFTIADFVADLRAPTPSAAAEIVAKSEEGIRENLSVHKGRLAYSVSRMLKYDRARLDALSRSLSDPRKAVQEQFQRLDEKAVRLRMSVTYLLKSKKERLERSVARLTALEPLAPLTRGFAIVRKLPDLEIVRDAAQVEKGDCLLVQVGKGEIECSVTKPLP